MSFACNEYRCGVLCDFTTGGKIWTDFNGLIDYCCSGTIENCVSCTKYYIVQSNCNLFDVPESEIDTVYIQQCDSINSDFYADFNNAVNNKAMSIFLASVMAGILAVRAVIKVIKGAVR